VSSLEAWGIDRTGAGWIEWWIARTPPLIPGVLDWAVSFMADEYDSVGVGSGVYDTTLTACLNGLCTMSLQSRYTRHE
jgi:hypothetical protein